MPISVLEFVSVYIGFTSIDESLVHEHVSLLQANPADLSNALLIFLEQHPEVIEQFSKPSNPSTDYWVDQQSSIFNMLVASPIDATYVEIAIRRGRSHALMGIPAICLIGIFEVYLKHAEKLIDNSDLPAIKKIAFERSLRKRLLLDKMLQVHGFDLATLEQKNHQSAQYAHLYRLYATLSHVSMAILHAGDRQTLFQSFCDAATKHGFSYAWVVEPNTYDDLIKPVAIAGKADFKILQQQKLSQSINSIYGRGPTGSALRSGEIQIINETRNLTSLEPWHQLFSQLKIRSIAVAPLKISGHVIACLSLYADEENFFREDEVALVTVIAREISHALERLATLQKNNEISAQLIWQKQHDELTGLPLREILFQRIDSILNSASDATHITIALLSIDNFRELNSRFGHAVGDSILCTLSDLLKERVGKYSLISRLGGNCFAIVADQPGWILPILESISKRIGIPQRVLGHTMPIQASLGVVTADQPESAEELLRKARVALDQARRDGGNRTVVFDKILDDAIHQKERLQKNIRHALRNRELRPFFQPKIDLISGKVLGAEALVRWFQGNRIISPSEFLPALSSSNLMILIDWAMLNAVTEILAIKGLFSKEIRSVSVNLSMQTLMESDFTPRLVKLIERHGLRPDQLELEVLETVVLQEPSIINNLAACQEMGYLIAIDDFGTAASSLVHLLEIPANTIKIDQRFAKNLLKHEGNHAIISSMMTYTKLSNKNLCIEGVETQQIWQRLVEIGCTQGQGYAIAHPMSLSEFEHWLNEQKNIKTSN